MDIDLADMDMDYDIELTNRILALSACPATEAIPTAFDTRNFL